jgi:myosin-5
MLVPLNIEQAISGRDALAKEIYFRVFQWLVLLINFNTCYAMNAALEEPSHDHYFSKDHQCSTISLLDIFGFENFSTNRFEQFCINYANERIQQKFTEDVFKTVQEEYEFEGILWSKISYKDNADVLELLEGHTPYTHQPRDDDTHTII